VPSLASNGFLSPGRHPTSLGEVEATFVNAAMFGASSTRRDVWDGFLDYLAAWQAAEEAVDAVVLRAIWLGGSFISAEMHPADLDVSPIYDAAVLESLTGKAGVGDLKRLFGHRERMVLTHKVEPFALPWRPIASTLFPERLSGEERDILSQRGGLDSWWGRTRPPGPRRMPELPADVAERGYLEVIL
jgi:hypothetical protein